MHTLEHSAPVSVEVTITPTGRLCTGSRRPLKKSQKSQAYKAPAPMALALSIINLLLATVDDAMIDQITGRLIVIAYELEYLKARPIQRALNAI